MKNWEHIIYRGAPPVFALMVALTALFIQWLGK